MGLHERVRLKLMRKVMLRWQAGSLSGWGVLGFGGDVTKLPSNATNVVPSMAEPVMGRG